VARNEFRAGFAHSIVGELGVKAVSGKMESITSLRYYEVRIEELLYPSFK
jgi:hypothetical protein